MAAFVSCLISNLARLACGKTLADITTPQRQPGPGGTRQVAWDSAAAIDPDKLIVRLASGGELPYDRLILSPGGLHGNPAVMSCRVPRNACCTWKAGPQTVAPGAS
ncbi:MAG: hypothetical protein U1F00_02345 [Rhodoferax sp.]